MCLTRLETMERLWGHGELHIYSLFLNTLTDTEVSSSSVHVYFRKVHPPCATTPHIRAVDSLKMGIALMKIEQVSRSWVCMLFCCHQRLDYNHNCIFRSHVVSSKIMQHESRNAGESQGLILAWLLATENKSP